jgi:O-antigen/teichoic acid export membrane protein
MAIASQLRRFTALRGVVNDALYRGSFFLLLNTVATSAIGFVFWTLAAHSYSAAAIGVFSSVTAGTGLLAAIAAVGLPITMTRHIAGADNPGHLVLVAITIITTAGTVLCLLTVLALGPHLPAALHLQQRGRMTILVILLVVFSALGTTLDAGLVAIRSSRFILIKNLVGSTAKLAAMLALAAYRSSGLFLAYAIGLVLATMLSGVALGWQVRKQDTGSQPFRITRRYLSVIGRNYAATVIGILPLTVVPIEVLAVRGVAETARFSIALLIAGFLNFIPSVMGQVLFAEIARGGTLLGKQLRKARHAVFGLLLPSLALLLVTAPFVLRLFGKAYAADTTGCLRVLALSALPAGGTYLIDSILIARDRTAAYTFMQISNAALILGGVGLLLPYGLTAAAAGMAAGQVLTLVLGLLVVAMGRSGRHRPRDGAVLAASAAEHREPQPAVRVPEPRPPESLPMSPMTPNALTAEQISWDQTIGIPQQRMAELGPAYSSPYWEAGRYRPGDVAQCSLWFPPIEIPVGFGQTRSASKLPVLVMMTGYSRWLSARLIPSRHTEDVLAGWWALIAELGAVPRTLIWHSEEAIGWEAGGQSHVTASCRAFGHTLNATVVVGAVDDPATTHLTGQAEAHLERSFLPGRSFGSPADFNHQLRGWLQHTRRQPLRRAAASPEALLDDDRRAMLSLPPIPPATGWQLPARVADHPFVHFDTNAYSVPPALVGRTVELRADLGHVRVLYQGRTAAQHDRVWARNRVIGDPDEQQQMQLRPVR